MADPTTETQIEQQAPPTGATASTQNGKGDEQQHGDDVDALKAELDKAKRNLGQLLNEKKRFAEDRQKLVDRLKAENEMLEEFGLEGPDQLREVLQQRSEVELKQARDKGEVDKLLDNQAKKFQRDIEKREQAVREREEQIARHRQTIDALTIDAQINAELGKVVDPAFLKGAFALHRPKARTVDDPEAPYGIRVVMDVAGDEWKVADYFKNWAETDPEAQPYLIGNRSTGGGAPPGVARVGGAPRMKRSAMTAKQKSDYMNEFGKEKYDSLPW